VHDRDDADELLCIDQDAAFVIAACPPGQVDRMVAMCRYHGVPVVLWHRQAAGEEAARALLELVGDDGPRDLREEVRRRRVKARKDERLVGAHLSLLWEDPRWDPAEVPLAEPVAVAVTVAVTGAGVVAVAGGVSAPEPVAGPVSPPVSQSVSPSASPPVSPPLPVSVTVTAVRGGAA